MNFNESQKLGCFINIVIRSILLIISVVCVAASGFACIHIFGSFYLGVVSFVFHACFGMRENFYCKCSGTAARLINVRILLALKKASKRFSSLFVLKGHLF